MDPPGTPKIICITTSKPIVKLTLYNQLQFDKILNRQRCVGLLKRTDLFNDVAYLVTEFDLITHGETYQFY